MQVIQTTEEFAEINVNQPFFLLKHSLTCPISAAAKEQYDEFAKTSQTPTYILHVQEARPLSNEIAEKFEVKHESPQALLFDGDKIVWNASHRAVTEETLKEIEESFIKKKRA